MAEPTSPILISELRFGNSGVYSPAERRPFRRMSGRPRADSMKQDSGGAIAKLVERLAADFTGTPSAENLAQK